MFVKLTWIKNNGLSLQVQKKVNTPSINNFLK